MQALVGMRDGDGCIEREGGAQGGLSTGVRNTLSSDEMEIKWRSGNKAAPMRLRLCHPCQPFAFIDINIITAATTSNKMYHDPPPDLLS
jgi:hypothetical protein